MAETCVLESPAVVLLAAIGGQARHSWQLEGQRDYSVKGERGRGGQWRARIESIMGAGGAGVLLGGH